jgi:sugar phosphate isomerase/epimerase
MFARLAVSMVLFVPLAPAAAAPPRLAGGFIQLQGWMMDLSPDDWRRELEAMRDVGLETIIIQYLQYGRHSFIPSDDRATDPTREILRFADAHGMRVFLGTRADEGWWHWDADYLDQSLAERKRLIRTIHARYAAYRSFAGWYFTEEVSGNLSPDRARLLRGYFRSQSDYCKALRAQPVAFAPFFSHLTPLESMRRIYDELLDGAGIDVVMLQDGVGARGWDRDLEERIVPFFRMFRAVCDRRGVALWSDLESFQRRDPAQEGGLVPTSPARLIRQLRAVAPDVDRIVTFDFFHYMSPHRGAQQRRLYDGYRRYVRGERAD